MIPALRHWVMKARTEVSSMIVVCCLEQEEEAIEEEVSGVVRVRVWAVPVSLFWVID